MPGFNSYNQNTTGTWQPQGAAPYYNPYQYPQQTSMPGYLQQGARQQPQNNLLRVTGPESAKAYSLPPNSSVVLFDADNPIFYLKSTDDSGFATLRTFEFAEKAPEVVDVQAMTATDDLRNEVDGMKTDISEIKKLLEGLVS